MQALASTSVRAVTQEDTEPQTWSRGTLNWFTDGVF